jgi:hypothetical protein
MSPGGGDSVPAAAGAWLEADALAAGALAVDAADPDRGADALLLGLPLQPAAISPVPARTMSRVTAPGALAFFMGGTLQKGR